MEKLYTVKELVEATGLSRTTINKHRVDGALRETYFGRAVRFAESSVEDWFARMASKN